MEVLQGIEGLKALERGAVISIGNYDGVHVGHAAIIAKMQQLAGNAPTAVVTFEPHPLSVLRPDLAPPRLSTSQRKQQLLADAGVQYLVILPPSPDVLGLTAEQFWEILRDHTQPSHIVEGRAFNFGKDRGGSIERLQEWASGSAMRIHLEPSQTRILCDRSIVDVSSSTIRWLLAYGRVADAKHCLGRDFELTGEVMRGFARGRTIGFPTANLNCGDLLVPAEGVYAGLCLIGGNPFKAAVSIGTTPTFEKRQHQVEIHLIDFTGDLYGTTITVAINRWVRDQMKFPNVGALKQQLVRDISDIQANTDHCISKARSY